MSIFKPSLCKDYAANLYVNKYMPKTLMDFKGNEGVKQTLLSYIETDNLPNLIITGPHGTGKSLLARLLINMYLGDKYIKEGCLEIYGSLNTGKEIVTEQTTSKSKSTWVFNNIGITNFIKKYSELPKNKYKIVIIYEFHQMSPDAQMALRSVIETNSEKVRFIFITEDMTLIIQALQSRCTPLLLSKLTTIDINTIIKKIMKNEKLRCDNELLEIINLNADGDLRLALNLLQILSPAKTKQEWIDILGIPEINCLKSIINNCISGTPVVSYRLIRQLLNNGFEINDLTDLLTKILINMPLFPQKDMYIRTLCNHMLIIQECYTDTQLYNLINQLSLIK